ncbi:MAG: YbaN family protein [Lysobacterales bacterium]
MYAWIALGLLFLLLGGIGVALPLLPTTPFVLLAAACFARSSPRLHNWLLRSQVFGPMLRDWEKNKCVSASVKTLAVSMMVVVGGISILFYVPAGWPRYAGLGLLFLGCLTILKVKTCPFQKP